MRIKRLEQVRVNQNSYTSNCFCLQVGKFNQAIRCGKLKGRQSETKCRASPGIFGRFGKF
nr:MAG TPA: hypothetical protein [Caudoviricetes sp.]